MMEIRTATPEDLPRLAALAVEFYASSRFLRGFDLQRFTEFWRQCIAAGIGVVYVLDVDGALRGALGGMIYPEPYSGEQIATEFFWFVSREFRGQGMRLYRRFEEWAREQGARQIRMVHLEDSMPDRLSAVYKRLGYEPAERHYVKELIG